MPNRRRQLPRFQMALILGIVFLAKALIPTGWMPVAANGLIELQLCSGIKAVPAASLSLAQQELLAAMHQAGADHGGDEPDDVQGVSDQPCSFAVAGLAWTAPDLAEPMISPALRSGVARAGNTAVAIGRGLAAPPPPSTGPPATA